MARRPLTPTSPRWIGAEPYRRPLGLRQAVPPGERVPVACAYCGTVTMRMASQVPKGQGFCDARCRARYRTEGGSPPRCRLCDRAMVAADVLLGDGDTAIHLACLEAEALPPG